MKKFLFPAIIFFATFSAHGAGPEAVKYSGFAQYENDYPIRFNLELPRNQTLDLKLNGSLALELSASMLPSAKPVNKVRLINKNGTEMHSASFSGDDNSNISFAYIVCGGKARYISPAPNSSESCTKK